MFNSVKILIYIWLNVWTFFPSFISLIFIEHLVCARRPKGNKKYKISDHKRLRLQWGHNLERIIIQCNCCGRDTHQEWMGLQHTDTLQAYLATRARISSSGMAAGCYVIGGDGWGESRVLSKQMGRSLCHSGSSREDGWIGAMEEEGTS